MARITRRLYAFAHRLMSHPAAPYHEHAVRAEVERICQEEKLPYDRDSFGNVLVRLHKGRSPRPLVLAAHMDHPGFEILRPSVSDRWLAQFRGGVPDEYFRTGLPVRLMPGAVPAKLGLHQAGKPNQRLFELHPRRPVSTAPQFAVWELEDFALRQGLIHGRACDDLVGVATVLAVLADLKDRRAEVHAIGVLSRAEEVGFHGALALAATGTLPKNALVVSLETSKELPGASIGKGAIVRVGDRSSVFSSAGTRFLVEIATAMGTKRSPFRFQRALMSGGTCEATAYQEFGYQSAAVCVALGNYHNCAPGHRIAAEFVSLADAVGMAELLAQTARRMPEYQPITQRLPDRLDRLRREALPLLRKRRG